MISLNEVDLLTITLEYVTGTIINAYLINFQVRIKHCLSNLFRNDHQWILVNMYICILHLGRYRFLHCGMDFGHSPKFLIHKKNWERAFRHFRKPNNMGCFFFIRASWVVFDVYNYDKYKVRKIISSPLSIWNHPLTPFKWRRVVYHNAPLDRT